MVVSRRTYVISDLHLGGEYGDREDPEDRGFRLCTHVEELRAFVDRLTDHPAGTPVTELVINGDLVDFLAEAGDDGGGWHPFIADASRAADTLGRIAARDRVFFDALARFIAKGHRLVMLLGNHDVELALPAVRRVLRDALQATDARNVHFVEGAEAYVVGDALIEHGNRYDEWNVVDHAALLRVRAFQSRNQPLPDDRRFEAPAGSVMVSSVMNAVKAKYRFVDLLKPEQDAVVPILLAIEPGYRRLLRTVAGLRDRAADHRLAAPALPAWGDIASRGIAAPSGFGDLAWRPDAAVAPPDPLDAVLAATLKGDVNRFLAEIGDAPLDATYEETLVEGEIASRGDRLNQIAGTARLLVARHNPDALVRRLPALRMALRVLRDNRSFGRDAETMPEYDDASRKLAAYGFKYVVFGHTHLARDVDLGGGARYFNSGTWCDLLRVPADIFSDSAATARSALTAFVTDLAANRLARRVAFVPTYVRLDTDADGHTVDARLCDYSGGAEV